MKKTPITGLPDLPQPRPEGLLTVAADPDTGKTYRAPMPDADTLDKAKQYTDSKTADLPDTKRKADANDFISRWGTDIDLCVETGVYPWVGTDGNHFTLVVRRSSTPDNAGFYSVEQTAYPREGSLINNIAKRIVFVKEGETVRDGRECTLLGPLYIKEVRFDKENNTLKGNLKELFGNRYNYEIEVVNVNTTGRDSLVPAILRNEQNETILSFILGSVYYCFKIGREGLIESNIVDILRLTEDVSTLKNSISALESRIAALEAKHQDTP